MTLATIDESAGLWLATKHVRPGWRLNTTLVRLDGGGTAALSPTRGLGDEMHAAIARIGAPEVLIAPNHFHHLGLREWTERYPRAEVVASSQAAVRLTAKAARSFEPLDAARARLPAHASLVELPGCKSGETWLRIETQAGVAWCVTDGFFHEPDAATGLFGFALRRMKTAPGLCIGWTWGALQLSDKRGYSAWLREAVDRDAPVALVPAHGVPIRADDLPDRLRDLMRARLPA